MSNEQTIKALRDALQAALSYHGVTLLTDPPQDAWKYHRVSERLQKALALTADASEDAPDELAAFEYWMLTEAKCIIGSSDPYPAGLERQYRSLWKSARAARPAPVAATPAPDVRDPVVEKVREALLQRSQFGIKKYGDTLHNMDYSERAILQHAIEEAMDLSNYLMARIMKIDAAAPAAPIAEVTVQTDRMTERKTNHIMERDGFQKVGYVLQKPGGDYCLSAQSAVRWLDQKQYWRLMHEQDDSLFGTREPTDEERHEAAVNAWLGPVAHAKPEPVYPHPKCDEACYHQCTEGRQIATPKCIAESAHAKLAEGTSRYLTIVFKVPAVDDYGSPVALLRRNDWTASSWSHAMNDRDDARAELAAIRGQQAGAVDGEAG